MNWLWHQRVTAIVIAFAIVAFWRGAWGLMDYYFLPKNIVLSYWLSIGIGILILLTTKSLVKYIR